MEEENKTMVEEKKKRKSNKLSIKAMKEYLADKEVEDIEWFVETFDELTNDGLTGMERHRKLELAFKEKYMPELLGKAKAATADDEVDELRELLKSRKKKK